jgi:hypothetical protein
LQKAWREVPSDFILYMQVPATSSLSIIELGENSPANQSLIRLGEEHLNQVWEPLGLGRNTYPVEDQVWRLKLQNIVWDRLQSWLASQWRLCVHPIWEDCQRNPKYQGRSQV